MNLYTTYKCKAQKIILFAALLVFFICKQSIVANAQGIPSYIPANGLLAWYPFNDNPNDESGYGHNGVIYGSVSYGTDRFGMANSCYQSDEDGMVDVPVNNFPVGNASRSWTAFFKCDAPYQSSPYGGRDFVTYGNNSYLGGRFTLYTTDSTIGIEYINGGVITPYTFDSAWHNLTITYSTGGSDSVKLYIDGLLRTSSVFNPISSFNTDTGLRHGIGGTMDYVPPFSDSWGGELDDIGVWNRALSPCEVWDIWIGSATLVPVITVTGSILSTANNYTGYQWLENGYVIQGATNSSYIADSSGSYQVAVTDSGGCSGTSTVANINLTGIERISSNTNDIIISPNPTSDIINIASATDDLNCIEVIDLLGRRVDNFSYRNTKKISISLSFLPPGNYFIRINNSISKVISKMK